MKKLITLSLMVLGGMIAVPAAEAKAANNLAITTDPQIKIRIGQGNRHRKIRRVRTVTTTRITRVGRFRYRETIRTTYLPNGSTRTQVISRERIGRG